MEFQDLQESVNIKMIQSSEKERLKDLSRGRLAECGWEDEMRALCRGFMRNKVTNSVKMDELINEITPKGKETLPDNVKAELLQRIRSFIAYAV